MKKAPLFDSIAEGPNNGSAHWIHARDGTKLRIGCWGQSTASKGTILVFPGRSGYIERYGRIVSSLHRDGFASLVVDWRGHGLSDRLTSDAQVGHVASFLDYQLDVEAIIDAANKLDLPKPWFLMGTSMGACIGLRALMNDLPVTAAVFNAPMWDLGISSWQKFAAKPLALLWRSIGKGDAYAPGCDGSTYVLTEAFENNDLTHDADMYDYWGKQASEQPSLLIGGPSMNWLLEALRECNRLSKVDAPRLPSLISWGDEDTVINHDAIELQRGRWPSAQFEKYIGARHDVLSEVPGIRTKALSRITGFLAEA